MGEYKIKKWYIIFIKISTPLMIALWIYTPIIFLLENHTSKNFHAIVFIVLLSLAMIIIIILGFVIITKYKIIITHNMLSVHSGLNIRNLKYQDIRGFVGNKRRLIIYCKKNKNKIIILTQYIEKSYELLTLFKEKFQELK